MRRLILVALLAACGVIAGAVVLGAASADRAPRNAALRLQLRALRPPAWLDQQIRAIERHVPKPAVHPRVLHAPRSLRLPGGFACPVSASSPCSSAPCVTYIAPRSVSGAVTRRHPRSCVHKDIQQIPVMAR